MTDFSLRTKQRYQSLHKALIRLEEVINKIKLERNSQMNDILQDSLIQRFEFTLELSWNLQKDIATELGYLDILGPKPAISKAFELELISNFEIWKEMLKSRNLTAHTYDQSQAQNIANTIIQDFYPELKAFMQKITVKFNFDV